MGQMCMTDAGTTLSTNFILYGIRYMVKDYSDNKRGRKEGNVILFNDIQQILFYMASDIW